MMKRTFGLVLILIMLFTFSKVTRATTTVFLGRTVEGHGEIDYYGLNDSSHIESDLVSLSYVKKVKFVITNQSGEFYGNNGKDHMESLDIEVGYPLYNDKKGLLYFTLTSINYSGYKNNFITTHEADGGLVGFEVVGIPSDKVQFEFGWHGAIGGSYRINADNLPLELMLLKFKLQYTLTDNLGLILYCQLKDFNNNDNTYKRSETINTTVIGFIYRL